MKKLGVILKRLALLFLAIYAIITFLNQQKILNSYAANCKDLDCQIEEANERQEELNRKKDSVNSNEYIEEMARDKLDMYMPNERVYISNE